MDTLLKRRRIVDIVQIVYILAILFQVGCLEFN